MDALRKSIGGTQAAKNSKPVKKRRKVASGQKEMLMPIAGKSQPKRLLRRTRRPVRNESRLKPRHLWSAPAANLSE
jgi:DNA end-binding protein Ku